MRSLNETTQLVRDEHKKIRGLFRQLEVLKVRNPRMFHPVIAETCDELQIYLELEEKLLYPRVHRAIKERSHLETLETEFIHQGLSDHREIADAIREVRFLRTAASASDWDDRVDDLISLSEAYLNAEERTLLPFMEKHEPKIDAELSMKWFDLADEIRAGIHATSPSDPSHAQNPSGGEQRRKAG